jgi:hypothetical protein
MEDVLIFVVLIPNLLHHNNVGVIYPIISNFKMELVISIPLYFVAMPQSMVIVIEAPFVITLAHIVVGMRFRPQIPRETELVSVHTKMPRKVDRIFVRQPLDPGGGGSDPLRPPRPSRCFGLPMMNLGIPPLPPNKPYC